MTVDNTGADVHGHALAAYPDEYNDARLLGINGEGVAAYLRDDEIIAATIDRDGELQFPTPEFGIAHELSLTAFDFDLPTYLELAREEHGEWRALSAFARQQRTDS